MCQRSRLSNGCGPIVPTVLVVAATAVAGGCTTDRAQPDATATTSTTAISRATSDVDGTVSIAPAVESSDVVWSRTDLQLIGQPVAVAAVAVAYTVEDRQLYLVSLDPASGDELWRQPASVSSVPPGIPVEPRIVGDGVVYLRDVGDPEAAVVVIADARTGRDVASSPVGVFVSPPLACDDADEDEGTASEAPKEESRSAVPEYLDACVSARLDDSANEYRLDVTNGEYAPTAGSDLPFSRPIGEAGLFDLRADDIEYLALVRDGQVRWQVALSEAFPSGFTTNYGWTWRLQADEGVYVGSVGYFDSAARAQGRSDLAVSSTVALDEKSGMVLWRDGGADMFCPPRNTLLLRCRVTGSAIWDPEDADPEVTYQDLDVTIEGFDVTTGTTTWSFAAGANQTLVDGSGLTVAGKDVIALSGPEGPAVLDLTTGERRRPADDESFWCLEPQTFETDAQYLPPGEVLTEWNGGELAAPCSADGSPSTLTPTWPATRALDSAQFDDDVDVVATIDGVTAFRARP